MAANTQPPAVKPSAPSRSGLKRFALKAHLYIGVGAGIFILLLGLTGSVIAFEQEIPRWVSPGLYFVQAGSEKLPQQRLAAAVDQAFAPARVRSIEIARAPDRAEVMVIGGARTTTRRAFINPYTGAILGTLPMRTRVENAVQTIHNLHLKLSFSVGGSWAKVGKWIMTLAGLMLCFEVIFGSVIWLKVRRARVKWRQSSGFRKAFDLHNAVGIYALIFILVMGVTGTVIGLEDPFMANWIYAATQSAPLPRPLRAHSAASPGTGPISVDAAMADARAALPGTTITSIHMPVGASGVYLLEARYPGETAPAAESTVILDQYSGAPLQVRNIKSSPGYWEIRMIRSFHTGDRGGLAGHIIASIISLVLVGMVITGVMIWWKKLAV